jgi:hypothetical protein
VQPQRRRIGCLGQFILLGLLLGVGFIAVVAVTNPWIYTVGGHLRLLPFWQLPPKLNLVGRWVGPNLVMDDKGTIASAFLADGALNPRAGAPGPNRAVTFVESQWWYGHPCPALAP